MRFKEKRDAEDVSKQKKKNFNTQKRKRSYLTHWYKAVFGRANIKKSRAYDSATFYSQQFSNPIFPLCRACRQGHRLNVRVFNLFRG